MDFQKHEHMEKRLIRWLVIATLALLVLVLGLQAWRMLRPGDPAAPIAQDAAPENGQAAEPLNPPASGVSPGKAALIEDVQALNPALSFDDLAALSDKELEQLRGAGAPNLPIGMSVAAHMAEQYAGTLEVSSVTSETDLELDESLPHYEVELHHPTLGDFEYKIDAYSGEVLEGLPDILRSVQAEDGPQKTPDAAGAPEPAAPASGTPKTQAPASVTPKTQAPVSGTPKTQTPAAQPSVIGEEAAKNAAFTHAGVSADGTTVSKCKLDWEDGRQVYEIEFWAGEIEYDYEIDAAAGTVLKSGQEWDHHHSGSPAAPQEPGSFIGAEAAKSAALTHAGVSAADAGYIRCELDEDDGRWLYEIEFQVGAVEYEYEIDAVSGAVLKAERDA